MTPASVPPPEPADPPALAAPVVDERTAKAWAELSAHATDRLRGSKTTAMTENVCAVGLIHFYDEASNEVEAYIEGGPGKVSLIAMSDGTVRWAK